MSDRWIFCDVCNDVSIQSVSGSGKRRTCWDCADRRIRNKAVQIRHKKEGWIAMVLTHEEYAESFPVGVNPNFEVSTRE